MSNSSHSDFLRVKRTNSATKHGGSESDSDSTSGRATPITDVATSIGGHVDEHISRPLITNAGKDQTLAINRPTSKSLTKLQLRGSNILANGDSNHLYVPLTRDSSPSPSPCPSPVPPTATFIPISSALSKSNEHAAAALPPIHPAVHTTLQQLEAELQLEGINMDRLLSHDGRCVSHTLNGTQQHLRENCTLRLCGVPVPWLLAVMQALMPFGRYFCYDIPGSISTQLKDYFNGELSSADILNFYSLVSFPCVVMCIVAGVIQKKVGIQRSCLLYVALHFFGQMIFTIGIQVRSYPLACVGRFIFGVGSDAVSISQSAYLVCWLSGPQLALAFALQTAIGRIGSVGAFAILPAMADTDVVLSLWVATALCLFSLVATYLTNRVDAWADAKVAAARQRLLSVIEERHSDELIILDHDPNAAAATMTLSWRSFTLIPGAIWFLCLVTGLWYVAALGFFTIASDILQNTGPKLGTETASFYLAIPNIVTLVILPVWGTVVDKTGRAIWWLVISSVMLLFVQVPFYLLANGQANFDPWPLMVLHGFAYSVGCSALWVVAAYVTKDVMYNLSLGVQMSVCDLFLAIAPFVIGAMQNSWPQWQYTSPIVLFMVSCVLTVFASALLVWYDARHSQGLLNSTEKEREKFQEKLEEEEGQHIMQEAKHAKNLLAQKNLIANGLIHSDSSQLTIGAVTPNTFQLHNTPSPLTGIELSTVTNQSPNITPSLTPTLPGHSPMINPTKPERTQSISVSAPSPPVPLLLHPPENGALVS